MFLCRKKIACSLALGLLSSLAMSNMSVAQTAAPAEPSPITANISLTNDYRYRGISQSNLQPAIQGGVDYAHPSGFYIGNWNSSIGWISDAASTSGKSASAPIEMDFYAGYKYEWSKGFTADFGVLQYYFPTSGTTGFTTNPNSTEVYAAQNFTFDAVTGYVKFSYSVTTLFGFSNSSGSNYTDLTVNYDTGVWGLTLNAHAGYQYIAGTASDSSVSNDSLYSFADWKLGATKDLGNDLSLSLAYIGTNTKNGAYINSQGKALGGDIVLATLTKTF